MKPDDIQAIELVIIGFTIGVLVCILYATIDSYIAIKRRNRTHQQLLDAGMDPVDISKMNLLR